MSEESSPNKAESLALAKKVEAAVQAAVRDALAAHKRAGNPIAVWENGQVVWIPPDEIVVFDLEAPEEP
jgi:hypothetical protein